MPGPKIYGPEPPDKPPSGYSYITLRRDDLAQKAENAQRKMQESESTIRVTSQYDPKNQSLTVYNYDPKAKTPFHYTSSVDHSKERSSSCLDMKEIGCKQVPRKITFEA
ncbi:unnamed protein product [Caenorhabditis sp. 36 PRJEB53466]|nr:unnamed protein product [Caenorhabditis sp. 36 PRJEB53466]